MPLSVQTFTTIADAAAALRVPDTAYLGGGTLAMRAANEGNLSFSSLVRVTDPGLSAIEISGGTAKLGASVTMAQIAEHPALISIADAARAVGGPAIRNMATVGGNLFAPSPYGDFATALLALDAVVHGGDDTMPIDAFLANRSSVLVVDAVSFALPRPETFRFLKISRVKPKGISVLCIAAILEEAGGTITSARIALGAMAERPIRAKAAERALLARPRTHDGIAPALAVIAEATAPANDAIASAWYRAEVLPVHAARLLLKG